MAPTLSSGKIWCFRMALLLLPFLLLGGLEAGLRLGGYGFDPHFFRPMIIGGENYFVQNDAFSYRFFPPDNARSPGPSRMKAIKPPGTIRIFIFGESAAMGDPEPSYGPARYMEAQLRERFPGTKFEIVNVAFTAINSNVILPIARVCARHDGDIWIVYMGNNEMVGPFGAATVFGRRAPPLPYIRFVTAVQETRIGQLAVSLARRLHRGAAAPRTSWGGMEMFLNNQIPPDSPLKEIVYRNFARNLNDILLAGTRSGAKVLLNTVAVNLRDCPPFASLPEGTNPSETAAAEFQTGQALLAQKDFAGAQEHLQRACDEDALPFRTDLRLNSEIRAAAQKYQDAGVTFFDAASALASSNADGLCGYETFFEHVHFDSNGSYRLGLEWAQQVEKLLPAGIARSAGGAWLSQDNCDERLGLSDWNRVAIIEAMLSRQQAPPFSSQPGNAERVAALQARVRDLRARMNAGDMAQTKQNFQLQISRQPDDIGLHENFGLFLQATGDLPGSIAEWQKAHELIPQDFMPFFQMGRFSSTLGQLAVAETDLRTAVTIRPSLTQGWFELGNVLGAQGKYTGALAAYAVAHRQEPGNERVLYRTGAAYAILNDRAAAMEDYREAIKLNPGDWEPHYELGGELDAAGKENEALAEFAEAARLYPDYSRVHFNYGVVLAKLGRLDDAQHEFEETLRLEPGYKNAQDSLAKIQFLKQNRH